MLINFLIIGYAISRKFIKYKTYGLLIPASFIFGFLILGAGMYLADLVIASHLNFNTAYIYNIIFTIISAFFLWKHYKEFKEIKFSKSNLIILMIFFIFAYISYWFDVKLQNGNILAYSGWADQLYHLSYIRSVAVGGNIPVQFPYFANAPISYHFMFDYVMGKISQAGLNSVFTINFVPALCMTAMCAIVVELSKRFFKSAKIGYIASILILFNGSLEIITWMQNLGHFPTIMDFIANKTQVTIQNSAIFSFDMFISQRHFALSIAVMLLFFLLLYEYYSNPDRKLLIPMTIILAITTYYNPAIFMVCGAQLFCYMILMLFQKKYKNVLEIAVCGIIALIFIVPQMIMYKGAGTAWGGYPKINLKIFADNFPDFFKFWATAFGIKIIFAIYALFVIKSKPRIFFLFALIPLIIANIWQFGLYGFDNNKLMWASYVLINIFAIYGIFNLVKKLNKPLQIIIVCILVICMTLSGVGDYFARIINQGQASFAYTNSAPRKWIEQNTPKTAVFLTPTQIWYGDNGITQITMAGRKVYCVSNCTWTSVNTGPREQFIENIYENPNLTADEIRQELEDANISYILIDSNTLDKYKNLRTDFFETNFNKVYQYNDIQIFSVN